MPSVQAIIFDLGNVIIDIFPERSLQRYREMGVTNIDSVYMQLHQQGWFSRLETGHVSLDELMEEFQRLSNARLSEQQLVEAWDALLGEIPEERIRLLEQLMPHYQLYLLSNTNSRHMEVIHRQVQVKFGVSHMGHWFRAAYYSYEIGVRKPQPEAYSTILDRHGLAASSVLMVDDLAENIAAAAALGMQVFHVQAGLNPLQELLLPNQ